MKLLLITGLIAASTTGFAATLQVKKFPAFGEYGSINAAIAAAQPNDTIRIGAGVYDEGQILIQKSLTIEGDGPQFVTIRGSTSFAIEGEPNVFARKTIILRGVTITNSIGDGIYPGLGTTWRIENVVIAACASQGVTEWSNRSDLRGFASTMFFRHCTFADNRGYAIHQDAYENASGSVTAENCIFLNNASAHGDNGQVAFRHAGHFFRRCIVIGEDLAAGNWQSIGHQDPVPLVGSLNFIDAPTGNYILRRPSMAADAGIQGPGMQDPDGTIADVGAYGGPGAAAFWPYPAGGPVVAELQVTPVVQQGGTLTIKASATTR